MSNSYFQFKQFRIDQDQCGMKVSTDACIQGAWTPITSTVKQVLDIGAGTALLSLMLAQRSDQAHIEAIELDTNAAQQAERNISDSPWYHRISLVNADVRDYHPNHKYDLIICNPPFFTNSLLGPKEDRNLARHSLSLSLQELFNVLSSNLTDIGYASILLPVSEHRKWQKLLEDNGWKIYHQLNIQPKPGAPANRVTSLCTLETKKPFLSEDLLIRDKANNYTPEFIHLMHPFYLAL